MASTKIIITIDYIIVATFYFWRKFYYFSHRVRQCLVEWCTDFGTRSDNLGFGKYTFLLHFFCFTFDLTHSFQNKHNQVFVISLHHIEYSRNRISSAVLLFYWLFIIIVDGVKLRTRVLDNEYDTNPTQFGLFVLSYALSLVVFVLENLERPKTQYIMLEEDEVNISLNLCAYCVCFQLTKNTDQSCYIKRQ